MNDKRRLYVWLDILGFSDEIIRDTESSNKLSRILDDFEARFVDEFKGDGLAEGKMISDGIILDFGEVSPSLIAGLKNIFDKIGKKQFDFMMDQEKLIRGGIAVGKTLMPAEKERYVSSGLVEAYKLESQQIHWPIIGTTMEQITKIHEIKRKETPLDSDQDLFGLRKTFNKDGKEIYFIDFISSANADDKNKFESKLQQMIDKIIDNSCKDGKLEDEMIDKYIGIYFKDFVSSNGGNIDNFRLNLKQMLDDNRKNQKTGSGAIDKYIWLYRYYKTSNKEYVHPFFEGVIL